MNSSRFVSRRNPQRKFEAIRKEYFPRWDRGRHWRCRFRRTTTAVIASCHGLCDPRKKIIYLFERSKNDLPLVVIHEICHAVTSGNHGPSWQKRMLKVATAAVRSGQSRLAKLLRQEVASYRHDAEVVTVKGIYSEIEDCIWDRPTISSFRSVVKLVAQRNLMTAEGFLKRFPRARRVYDEAIALKKPLRRHE